MDDTKPTYLWEGCEAGTWMWFIHHHRPLEILTEPASSRAAFICRNKPAHEIEIRLQWMRPVRNVDRIPLAVREAGKVYKEAGDACDDAWMTYSKAHSTRQHDGDSAYKEVYKAYIKAWETCDKARKANNEVLRIHRADIEALHAEECPDCPWDGKTLFPEKKGDTA